MIDILTMVGVIGASYYYQNKSATNDHEKIIKIAEAAELKKKGESIRIYKKRKTDNYIEYVYKIPLGLSFKDFEDKKHIFIDGLNNKSKSDINLNNIKNIRWSDKPIPQIKEMINNRIILDKQVEMEYDGMLKVRVYDEGLRNEYKITKEIMGKCNGWSVPLGLTLNNQIMHDFESQSGSHVLIGGATDTGKSTILNVIINTLINNHPNDVKLSLVDLKGGLEFGVYENMKQVKNFATNIDEVEEVLKRVQQEMETMFRRLKMKGKKSVKHAGIKKRHFVIIDEAAEITSDGETDKEIKRQKIRCENYIKDIARRGRASGIKLIYSTQNPTSEVIGSQIKRNLITRISLPVDTSIASGVILDEGGAEKLPLIQGRSIYKRHRCQTMQAYNIEDNLIDEIISPYIKKEVADVKRTPRENTFKFI